MALLTSCLNDRDFPLPDVVTGPGDRNNIERGTIVINEFEARGSQFYNELVLPGNPDGGSDWIELYNTTNDTITMESGHWFVTDSLADAIKYELPEIVMDPKSFIVLWCDTLDTVITQIHTNFSLTKTGEDIGLLFKQANDSLLAVDDLIFGSQLSGTSYGRNPDGSSNWDFFPTPTPGSSNQ